MARLLANKHHDIDPVWHVQILVVAAVIMQFILPQTFSAEPRQLIAILSFLLVIALSFTTPKAAVFQSIGRRINVIVLVALLGVANTYSLYRVANQLLEGKISNGRDLVLTALNIFLTNIVVFALLYWEIDGGGPGKRKIAKNHERDFMFPQHNLTDFESKKWIPTFVDYFYVSSTNAMAFSPTDAMPLSRRIKMLMLTQSIVSLTTIALIISRAVNILRIT
ncbi:MAG: hypothetical protein NTV95_04070 [Candidatus Saccharibacteria bacterium]|nr:hypothetical protein [Candidatus Saccharibacteria bacterium]